MSAAHTHEPSCDHSAAAQQSRAEDPPLPEWLDHGDDR